MQQGSKLTTTNRVKLAATLLLTVLTLLLVSGAAPAGVVLDRAGAQEEDPGEAAEKATGGEVPEPPETGVVSWAIMDADSGEFLVGQEPDEQLPIGSVTKIMSALVVMQEGTGLDDEVPISGEAESYVGGVFSNVGLIAEERVTVRDLLVASLVASGTEAVYALAEYVGDGSVEQFVGMMNEEASRLGLENTNFETPAGLDTADSYSSARDLAILTREMLQEPLLAEIVDTPEATISTQNRQIEIVNTNQLLNTYPPATGVKTGTTPEAGANLVASAESNDESFIAVVIGADDSDQRFLASELLLEYAFERYERRPLVNQDEVYGEAPLPYRADESVQLAATEEIAGLVDEESDVERRVTTQEELPPSASAGDELGEVEVLVNGRRVGESPLVAQEGYEEASLWQKTRSTVGGLLDSVQGAISGLFPGE
ncbi:MAG: D-alanyl-D-alanine carboxypeptidase [Rubrobacter sp.]|nr:D-alanyl-D-alanine carboxypeptidase [Rubrobacter sp.]